VGAVEPRRTADRAGTPGRAGGARRRAAGPPPAGLLHAARVEHEETGEGAIASGLRELDAHLAERPAEVLAWLLRGFLHLRAGRLAEAERDLDVAAGTAPSCGVVHFYRALLAAARDAEPEGVLRHLERAAAAHMDIAPAEPERLADYPELAPYLASPSFRAALEELG